MWHRDEGAEQLMNQIGLRYELRSNIPISKLKIKESLENNARFGNPLDEQRVEQYSYEMTHGIRFPAPVIDGQYLILAGNQRVNAARKAGRQAIDGYVITAGTQSQIDDFIRRDNTRHGKGLTEDEKVQTCVELHRKHKTPINKLNDMYFGGSTKTYARIVSANQAKHVEEKLLEKNIVATKMSTSSLAALHPIAENINVLRDAAILCLDFNLNSNQVDELVKSVREAATEADRLTVIRSRKNEVQHHTKKGAVLPEVQLRRQVIAFRKFIETGHEGKPFPPLETLFTDKAQKKEFKETIDSIIDGLKRLKEKVR